MRFTYKWLCEHLDTDQAPEVLGSALTSLGLELEGLDDLAAKYSDFSVCYVRKAWQHPDADNLKVCEVVYGKNEEVAQVVCGAPNAREGMYGIFAPVGSVIPSTNLKLKRSKIRGVESSGMLCSERELEISDNHDGIIVVEGESRLGTPFAVWRGIDDVVYDIGVTPNRGDCLGVYGVARDLAAGGFGKLKTPAWFDNEIAGVFDSPMNWVIDPSAFDAVRNVTGRSFRGVQNLQAPHWMVERLKIAGTRTISTLVDISNYVMYDMGRPTHVYDRSKLCGDHLVLRTAKEGEAFRCLHGEDHRLCEGTTVIADSKRVQGVAGIMGGEHSGCDEQTTDIFIEVAGFTPSSVVRDGRKTGIQSDARYRFERGVDRQSCAWGLQYISQMIQKFCGGEASHIVGDGEGGPAPTKVFMSKTRVQELTGVHLPQEQQEATLSALGFATQADSLGFYVTPPSWRFDITTDACLVEEIIRIYGIDRIPSCPVSEVNSAVSASVSLEHRRARLASGVLAERGLYETLSMSFCSEEMSAFFRADADPNLRLVNPMTRDMAIMRPSVLATVLPQLVENITHQRFPLGLFEVGPQYRSSAASDQETVAAGIRSGMLQTRHWDSQEHDVSVFTVKADVLSVLESLGVSQRSLVQKPADEMPESHYEQGYGATLFLGKTCIASFGMLDRKISDYLEVSESIMGFEIFIDRIPASKQKSATKRAWRREKLLPVERDFAFLLEKNVPTGQVMQVIKKTAPDVIRNVDVFDIFEGKDIKEGYQSVALQVVLQPAEKSFTDSELSDVSAKIVLAVQEKFNAVVR